MSKELALAALERHRLHFNNADRESWLRNVTEIPFIEEPAGSPVRHGCEHFGSVMDALVERGIGATIAPPTLAIVNGDQVAAHLTVTTVAAGIETTSHVIDVFEIARRYPCLRRSAGLGDAFMTPHHADRVARFDPRADVLITFPSIDAGVPSDSTPVVETAP
ncbi:hypothetical protein [Rhodococcus sp. B50]|uniref:hypothetical protein n=1 Tax=Rhodococcus sp. B50 TaxID=2682847 RepID=UPI001BD4E4F6|nr:hypothetical protein [Rhodococcus sp. B50]